MNFKIAKKYTYFDSARSSGIYEELFEWRKNHDRLLLEKGSQFRSSQEDFIEEIRNGVGIFFSTNKWNVYLTQSFSVGFKSLLNILDSNLKFLLIENDYPSILEQVKTFGLDYDLIENNNKLEETILIGLENYKPQVLVFTIKKKKSIFY